MRKRYLVTTEVRRYTIDLDEKELEQVRQHYHGYVKVEEMLVLDFDAIARELNGEKDG